AAGSSGTAATTWAAACRKRTLARSDAGRRSDGTSPRSRSTAIRATRCVGRVSVRHYCIGPTTAARFEVSAEIDMDLRALCKRALTPVTPGVILTDLMDRLGSRARPQERAANPRYSDIGMAAHALDSGRKQAIATGCDEFDVKLIEFESLLATIRRVI